MSFDSIGAEELSARYIDQQLNRPESRQLEFKEARSRYKTERLEEYCCALANVGGGSIFFGITDQQPRKVVGTSIFEDFVEKEHRLRELLRLPVIATEHFYRGKRVIEFKVPSRPRGRAISLRGVFWTRSGESLVPMEFSDLTEIHLETKIAFEREIARAHCTPDEIFKLLDVHAICRRLNSRLSQTMEEQLRELEQLQLIEAYSKVDTHPTPTN